MTLIKSGIEPNPTTDYEEHFFTYALYPHAEGWRAAGTVKEAYMLNQPLIAVNGGEAQKSRSFASVDKENVILETIKKAEDGEGTILRMYESENAKTNAWLTVNRRFAKAYICNLLEEAETEAEVDGNRIAVPIKPYEIVTVKIV